MLQSYLTTAIRNLSRRKGYTFLNVLGLSIGLTAFLLILQYVHFERSYDQFHERHDNIYRLSLEQYQNGELVIESAENYPALGPAMAGDFPEVQAYARLYNLGAKNNMVVTNEDAVGEPIKFKQRRLLYASGGFLLMFSYEVLAGNAETALAEPFQMVITESYAKKYFGAADPLGKMLRMQDDDFNDELCRVSAVVKDPPPNTHLKFDVLISYSTLYSRGRDEERARSRYDHGWRRKDMYTYVQVRPGTDQQSLQDKLANLASTYMPFLEEENRKEHFVLQPIEDIHLYSALNDEPETHGDGRAVTFLLIVALFILLIAYINYINLATARSLERANEVGVRKVMGASRSQLIGQFLMESILVNLVAILLSIGLFALLVPAFGEVAGLPEGDQLWEHVLWKQGWFVGLIVGFILLGSLLSGLYPAFILSGFMPIQVLSGKLRSSRGSAIFRKGLVIFQFAACVALIIGTMTVRSQLRFMQSQELGFDPEQILVVERPGVRIRDAEARQASIDGFKSDLEAHASISDVSSTLMVPGRKMRWRFPVRRLGDDPDQTHSFHLNLVDFNFVDAFGMQIVAGRNFDRSYSTDVDTACLITEGGARMLGFQRPEDAIGITITDGGDNQAIIVGIVGDYHQESLHHPAPPTLFFVSDYAEYYLMRVQMQGVQSTVAVIEQVWQTRFPGNPFHYFFMEEFFDAQYKNDQQFGQMFGLFSLLAILIGALGLVGLSAYMAQQRVKEIGVRKVLGANVPDILVLLSKDFLKLVGIANLLAWPIIGWIMHNWLEGFALRTSLSWWVFVLAAILVIVIAFLTVSFQSLRTARIDPVKALRTE
ncbi:MAG: ABC transporter permease [Bacteroidota bacterium]